VTLKLIRLELARTADHPEGSHKHGYEFIAPLGADAHIDLDEYKRVGEACSVLRFWGDADDEHGILVRTRGNHWAFSYAPGEDDDEPITRFASHAFRNGEYVTITEHDGVARPFRVVWVRDPPTLKGA
jgi:hypothetical protein